MPLSSTEIKRQILMGATNSPMRKKMEQPPGISEGEMIEIGNDLEAVTRQRGWTLIESYMLRRMNLVGLAMSDQPNADQKGIAKGFIELMQWIHLSIQKRDELLEGERIKHETKNVPKKESKQTIEPGGLQE